VPFPSDIKTLTSLRFFAAVLIILNHLKHYLLFDMKDYTGLWEQSYLAVDFFFILSGFILTHVYLGGIESGQLSIRSFLIRRLARLYPLHLLTLLIMTGLAMTSLRFGSIVPWSGHFPVGTFVLNFLLLHGWGFVTSLAFNIPSWSISAEWFAYMSFPFLLPWLLAKKPGFVLIISFGGLAALWALSLIYFPRPTTQLTSDCSILRIMPEFTVGCCLYLVARRLKPLWRPGLLLSGGSVVALMIMHFSWPDLLIIPVFMLIIVAAADLTRKDYRGWLASDQMVFWGEASYAIYMVHYVVIVLILNGAYNYIGQDFYAHYYPALFALTTIVIFVVAALVHVRFEHPARRWVLKRFDQTGRGNAAAAGE